MLKSGLCNCNDMYMVAKGTVPITETRANAAGQNVVARNKQVTFKCSAPFTNCISKINNTQVDK